MGIKILDVKINDLDYIIELNQNSRPAVSDMDMNSAEYFFKNSEYFKILKYDNNLIGFLIALSDDSDYSSVNYQWFKRKYESFIYIDRIILEESHQNKGYGNIFYEDLKKNAALKYDNMFCEVNIIPYNGQSINFHNKYGFKELSKEYIENDEKRVVYLGYKL